MEIYAQKYIFLLRFPIENSSFQMSTLFNLWNLSIFSSHKNHISVTGEVNSIRSFRQTQPKNVSNMSPTRIQFGQQCTNHTDFSMTILQQLGAALSFTLTQMILCMDLNVCTNVRACVWMCEQMLAMYGFHCIKFSPMPTALKTAAHLVIGKWFFPCHWCCCCFCRLIFFFHLFSHCFFWHRQYPYSK